MRAAIAMAASLALGGAHAAHAAPIGPDNYDFATFAPAVLTHHVAHYGGWTQVLGDLDGDHRVDRLVHAIDAAGVRTWTSRPDGELDQTQMVSRAVEVLDSTGVRIYPALADWFFIDWMGGGWQQQAQICYEPTGGAAHCVGHIE